MEKKLRVGIIGATGMVGQRFACLLENHPWFDVVALAASKRSSGLTYEEAVGDRWKMDVPMPEKYKKMVIMDADNVEEVCSKVDFVFCAVSLNKEETKKLEERYAKCETPVVSNNSANRHTPDVPMIIPEVNADHAAVIETQKKRLGTKRGFISVKSNCSIQSYGTAVSSIVMSMLGVINVTASGNSTGAYVYNGGIILLHGTTPELVGGVQNTNYGGLIARGGRLL